MNITDGTAFGMRIDHIINTATGKPVKVSEGTTWSIAKALHPDTFIAGYQARLGDEWQERHTRPYRYVVRLLDGEPMESFTATSHGDQGEWIVFTNATNDTQMLIKKDEVLSLWREPIEVS